MVRDIIDGHPQTSYKLFQMDKKTFLNLYDHFERHKNLQDTRLVTVEKAIAIFLLIVGHMWESLFEISVNTDISVLEFYRYIENIGEILVDILTKILVRWKLFKIHENV